MSVLRPISRFAPGRHLAQGRPFNAAVSPAVPQCRAINTQHHFDTRRFELKLEKEGFTPEQSKSVMKAMSRVLEDSFSNLGKNLVTREQFSRQTYQQKVDFAKLKGEMQHFDKSGFNKITSEHDRLKKELEKMRQRLKEDITKTNAHVRLDLSLEKGRIKTEAAAHEMKIQDTASRVEQEISQTKSYIDTTKVTVLQWLVGIFSGAVAIALAYIRFLT
ncbi:YALIA101S12e01002g1_1 [Yarrowia lipolytica]|jgi:hypothetical protein|nr:Protein FMP32 [Yarrowia lipolytica]SEI36489.1 YALIA101S12e01002g1_1 [Yarrowia lipolytica]